MWSAINQWSLIVGKEVINTMKWISSRRPKTEEKGGRFTRKEKQNDGQAEHENRRELWWWSSREGGAACEPFQDPASESLWADVLVQAKDCFLDTCDWNHSRRTSKNEDLTKYKWINHPLPCRYRDLQQKQKSWTKWRSEVKISKRNMVTQMINSDDEVLQ